MTDINDVIKTIDELIDGGVLTQYAIAREAGISDGTLSAFRKGKYKGDNAAVAARQVFANTAPDATKASGVGVSLMRNGKILATGENVSLGTVNKSKVPLGLSATYGQTGNKVSAGTVQSVIGVTFIYE